MNNNHIIMLIRILKHTFMIAIYYESRRTLAKGLYHQTPPPPTPKKHTHTHTHPNPPPPPHLVNHGPVHDYMEL